MERETLPCVTGVSSPYIWPFYNTSSIQATLYQYFTVNHEVIVVKGNFCNAGVKPNFY